MMKERGRIKKKTDTGRRRVAGGEERRHNERERGETLTKIESQRETVHLSRETASVTVSHSRIKRHASICCC